MTLRHTTGRHDFTPSEILTAVRAAGSLYRDSTVRTHVSAHMVEDGTLLRTAPGRYRLALDQHHPVDALPVPVPPTTDRISEDSVKAAVKDFLEADGWNVTVMWGRDRGIDIEARRGTERLVVEAKGEAPPGPQQVNYFLNALGELVQRMDDPAASYGLALPDHQQYHRLVERLPGLARERFGLTVFFVRRSPDGTMTVQPG